MKGCVDKVAELSEGCVRFAPRNWYITLDLDTYTCTRGHLKVPFTISVLLQPQLLAFQISRWQQHLRSPPEKGPCPDITDAIVL